MQHEMQHEIKKYRKYGTFEVAREGFVLRSASVRAIPRSPGPRAPSPPLRGVSWLKALYY